MANTSGWRRAGMEVPILSADSIDWVQVSVPSSSSNSVSNVSDSPLAKDFGSCYTVGSPPSCFIWKAYKSQTNLLEIIELCSHKEISRIGLRLEFPDAIFPFAFIYNDESQFVSQNHLVLYALTLSGVAYAIRLRNNFDYRNASFIPIDEVFEYNTDIQPHSGAITAVTAAEGCILIGKRDGSVGCFRLDLLDATAPGFASEFRDDAGFGRLWGILSRSPALAAVQDLAISTVHQSKLLYVLHADGSFRVWDLFSHSKICSHAMASPSLTGPFVRLWVGESNPDGMIPVVLLHKQSLEVDTETILLFSLRHNVGAKTPLSLEPPVRKIPLGEGGPIDVKLTSDKIWILKKEGLVMQGLFHNDAYEGSAHYFTLQEAFVADLLFQSSERLPDDLLWLAYSAFSSSKEEIVPFVSSVFLRGLLFPGIHSDAVLRQTLADYNKHFTDSEFNSFTVDGLKNEILSLIEHQGGSESPVSILQCWKAFSAHYLHNWCKYNAACGLLMDSSTEAIGLVRTNTISLCRGLEDVEQIIYGSFDGQNENVIPGLGYSGDEVDWKILLEVLQCVQNVRQQLGKASSSIFYESLLSTPHISSEELVPRFLSILETGYSTTIAALQISELGSDTAWEKELSNHRNLRKFSTNMFLSLNALCDTATSWDKVLGVVESFLNFLVPRKIELNLDSGAVFSVNGSAIVQTTSQIARVMFESTLDILMLLSYMTSISGQINMSYDDLSKIKLELIPMIQEIVTEWHIIHFFGTTPSESPAIEDFSIQLSSLQIDSNPDKRLWNGRLGKCEFSLAFIMLFSMQSFSGHPGNVSFKRLPSPGGLITLSREFTSWIIWGRNGEESSVFFSHSNDLALILLRHGQYNATEYLLTLVDSYSRKEKHYESLQAVDRKLAARFHLLGCCLVAQTQHGLRGPVKDRKIGEAVCCFFRAASVEGSPQALKSLPHEAGWLQIDSSGSPSSGAWKLQYYQWVMQLFEQHNLSEAACQFTLAALEQVDEALNSTYGSSRENFGESVTTVRGRLWANVFKFTLDLENYHDAFCAIISNPDEDSKNICLRRFVIVLYERRAVKMLCDGQLPLIGLVEKVERELAWKAERSDLSTRPNPFKLLYAFEMHRHNWRRAASCMYLYSVRLRAEAEVKDHQLRSSLLQERLNGLSTAINALQLVNPAYAWIEAPVEEYTLDKANYPNKKARIIMQEPTSRDDALPEKVQSYLDVEKLENEYVLASAEYLLSVANVKWTSARNEKPSSKLIDLLVDSNSYDMAFTVIIKFWKGSGLKRELGRVFSAMALKCCPTRLVSSFNGRNRRAHGLLLTSSEHDVIQDALDAATATKHSSGSSHWETLELYLHKYRASHPRLPLIVAETLLSTDPQIELPLWLISYFKGVRNENTFGMSGNESDPASLFRLYVDYGRYAEAINLFMEYSESLTSLHPADIIRRKRPFSVWFPYTSVERLWCLLEESTRLGHRIDECEKLKKLLHGVLVNHLNTLKVDSDDVQA